MARSRFAPRPGRLDLGEIFVDREAPIARFRQELGRIPRDRSRVLVFHGVGGQGKSHLCAELRRQVQAETAPKHLHHAHLNLHLKRGTGERSPARFMLWLRNALAADTRIALPAFDIAFALYWREAFPDTPLPRRKEWSFLFRRGAEVADVGGESGGALADHALEGLIEGLPFVGMSLRRLIRWGLPVLRERYHNLTNDALAAAYRDGEPLPAEELLPLLPYFLGRDLAVYLEDQHRDTRFVFLIDEYESVLAAGGAEEALRDEPLDIYMREVVACCPASLFVFFSREKLRWDQDDPLWAPDLAGAQVPLRGLADADADALLRNARVEEADLRAAMVDGARAHDPATGEDAVYPFMLELQVGHYLTLKEMAERDPAPEDFRLDAPDFQSRRNELLHRFTRDYDPAFRATLRRLAVGRAFDRETFTRLVTAFHIPFPLDEFGNLCALSFVDDAGVDDVGEGRFVFHKVIREALAAMLDAEDRAATHRVLFEHYTGRAADGAADGAPGEDRVPDLAEALHHRMAMGGDGLLDWWRGAREPYREAHRQPALEPLERVLVRHARALSPQDPGLLAAACLGLAQNLAAQGRPRDAARAFHEALGAANAAGDCDLATRVAILTGLGTALSALTQWPAADQMFGHAEEILEAAPGSDPVLLATTLNNHGVMLTTAGRLDEAEARLRRALEIQDKTLVRGDPRIGAAATNLAAVLDGKEAYAEAERWHATALQILRRAHGAGDLRTGKAHNNLGLNLAGQERFAEAVIQHHRAQEILEKLLPPDHPDIAATLANLAAALRARDGDGNPALPDLLARAVDIREGALGPLHFDTLKARGALVEVLRAQGRDDEAGVHEAVFRGLAERAMEDGEARPRSGLSAAFTRHGRPAPGSDLYNGAMTDNNADREDDDDGKPGS